MSIRSEVTIAKAWQIEGYAVDAFSNMDILVEPSMYHLLFDHWCNSDYGNETTKALRFVERLLAPVFASLADAEAWIHGVIDCAVKMAKAVDAENANRWITDSSRTAAISTGMGLYEKGLGMIIPVAVSGYDRHATSLVLRAGTDGGAWPVVAYINTGYGSNVVDTLSGKSEARGTLRVYRRKAETSTDTDAWKRMFADLITEACFARTIAKQQDVQAAIAAVLSRHGYAHDRADDRHVDVPLQESGSCTFWSAWHSVMHLASNVIGAGFPPKRLFEGFDPDKVLRVCSHLCGRAVLRAVFSVDKIVGPRDRAISGHEHARTVTRMLLTGKCRNFAAAQTMQFYNEIDDEPRVSFTAAEYVRHCLSVLEKKMAYCAYRVTHRPYYDQARVVVKSQKLESLRVADALPPSKYAFPRVLAIEGGPRSLIIPALESVARIKAVFAEKVDNRTAIAQGSVVMVALRMAKACASLALATHGYDVEKYVHDPALDARMREVTDMLAGMASRRTSAKWTRCKAFDAPLRRTRAGDGSRMHEGGRYPFLPIFSEALLCLAYSLVRLYNRDLVAKDVQGSRIKPDHVEPYARALLPNYYSNALPGLDASAFEDMCIHLRTTFTDWFPTYNKKKKALVSHFGVLERPDGVLGSVIPLLGVISVLCGEYGDVVEVPGSGRKGGIPRCAFVAASDEVPPSVVIDETGDTDLLDAFSAMADGDRSRASKREAATRARECAMPIHVMELRRPSSDGGTGTRYTINTDRLRQDWRTGYGGRWTGDVDLQLGVARENGVYRGLDVLGVEDATFLLACAYSRNEFGLIEQALESKHMNPAQRKLYAPGTTTPVVGAREIVAVLETIRSTMESRERQHGDRPARGEMHRNAVVLLDCLRNAGGRSWLSVAMCATAVGYLRLSAEIYMPDVDDGLLAVLTSETDPTVRVMDAMAKILGRRHVCCTGRWMPLDTGREGDRRVAQRFIEVESSDATGKRQREWVWDKVETDMGVIPVAMPTKGIPGTDVVGLVDERLVFRKVTFPDSQTPAEERTCRCTEPEVMGLSEKELRDNLPELWWSAETEWSCVDWVMRGPGVTSDDYLPKRFLNESDHDATFSSRRDERRARVWRSMGPGNAKVGCSIICGLSGDVMVLSHNDDERRWRALLRVGEKTYHGTLLDRTGLRDGDATVYYRWAEGIPGSLVLSIGGPTEYLVVAATRWPTKEYIDGRMPWRRHNWFRPKEHDTAPGNERAEDELHLSCLHVNLSGLFVDATESVVDRTLFGVADDDDLFATMGVSVYGGTTTDDQRLALFGASDREVLRDLGAECMPLYKLGTDIAAWFRDMHIEPIVERDVGTEDQRREFGRTFRGGWSVPVTSRTTGAKHHSVATWIGYTQSALDWASKMMMDAAREISSDAEMVVGQTTWRCTADLVCKDPDKYANWMARCLAVKVLGETLTRLRAISEEYANKVGESVPSEVFYNAVELVCASRVGDSGEEDGIGIDYGPRDASLLLTEVMTGYFARKDQIRIMQDMTTGPPTGVVYHMGMGRGKTSFVIPRLTIHHILAGRVGKTSARGISRVIAIVVPGHLAWQTVSGILNAAATLYSVRVVLVTLGDRNNLLHERILTMGDLDPARDSADVVPAKGPGGADKFIVNFTVVVYTDKALQVDQMSNLVNGTAANFWYRWRGHVALLFDEIDSVADPRSCDLNFSVAEKLTAEESEVRRKKTRTMVSTIIQYLGGKHPVESTPTKVREALEPYIDTEKKMVMGVDYGLGDDDPRYGPSNPVTAIPYNGVNNPLNGSTFTSPELRLVLTHAALTRTLSDENGFRRRDAQEFFDTLMRLIGDASIESPGIGKSLKSPLYGLPDVVRAVKSHFRGRRTLTSLARTVKDADGRNRGKFLNRYIAETMISHADSHAIEANVGMFEFVSVDTVISQTRVYMFSGTVGVSSLPRDEPRIAGLMTEYVGDKRWMAIADIRVDVASDAQVLGALGGYRTPDDVGNGNTPVVWIVESTKPEGVHDFGRGDEYQTTIRSREPPKLLPGDTPIRFAQYDIKTNQSPTQKKERTTLQQRFSTPVKKKAATSPSSSATTTTPRTPGARFDRSEDVSVVDPILSAVEDLTPAERRILLLASGNTGGRRYTAVMDACGALRRYIAREYARRLAIAAGTEVLFVENGTKMLYVPPETVRVWDTSRTAGKDTMIFYDQKHTVGTDVKQVYEMRALVIVDSRTRRTAASQAGFRLRRLTRGHTLDFAYVLGPHEDLGYATATLGVPGGLLKMFERNETAETEAKKLHGTMNQVIAKLRVSSRNTSNIRNYHRFVWSRVASVMDGKDPDTVAIKFAEDEATALVSPESRELWRAIATNRGKLIRDGNVRDAVRVDVGTETQTETQTETSTQTAKTAEFPRMVSFTGTFERLFVSSGDCAAEMNIPDDATSTAGLWKWACQYLRDGSAFRGEGITRRDLIVGTDAIANMELEASRSKVRTHVFNANGVPNNHRPKRPSSETLETHLPVYALDVGTVSDSSNFVVGTQMDVVAHLHWTRYTRRANRVVFWCPEMRKPLAFTTEFYRYTNNPRTVVSSAEDMVPFFESLRPEILATVFRRPSTDNLLAFYYETVLPKLAEARGLDMMHLFRGQAAAENAVARYGIVDITGDAEEEKHTVQSYFEVEQQCFTCGRSALYLCGACKSVRFCSRRCQAIDFYRQTNPEGVNANRGCHSCVKRRRT